MCKLSQVIWETPQTVQLLICKGYGKHTEPPLVRPYPLGMRPAFLEVDINLKVHHIGAMAYPVMESPTPLMLSVSCMDLYPPYSNSHMP